MPTKHIAFLSAFAILALLASIATCSTLYKVDESEYALQLRFGRVESVRMDPRPIPQNAIHRRHPPHRQKDPPRRHPTQGDPR